MSFLIVSNDSTSMCAYVNRTSTRMFCHAQIDNSPLFLPADSTFADLVKADKNVALAAEGAITEYCWSHMRDIMCSNIARPCLVLTPPTDSGLCKSTCNAYIACNKQVDMQGDFLDLCNDKEFVIDNTKRSPENEKPICGSTGTLKPVVKYALIAMVALNAIVTLQHLSN